MPDLKQRLDAVDQIPVDDLWPLIRERFEDEAAGRVTPLRAADPHRGPEVGWRRALTIAAVLVLVAAAGLLLVRSLTSERIPATPPEPRPAPAALGTLAYALDGDIYVSDADGSNAVRIADGRSPKDCPNSPDTGEYWVTGGSLWSPDGRYLAYRHSGCSGEQRDVVISDAEGNVVATFPAQGWRIAWSPDSTRVAVWDTWGETVGVYGLDGARVQELSIPPGDHGGGDNDPSWEPDGTSLMVGNLEVPLDGSMPHKAVEATVSPDGSHIAYGTRRSVMIASSDGTDAREVFGDRPWGSIPWSPTGDRFAFTTSSGPHPYITDELRVFDVATGSVTLLAEGERGTTYEALEFSGQGDRILFVKGEDDQASLWSIRVDGSHARLVVAGTSNGDWLSP